MRLLQHCDCGSHLFLQCLLERWGVNALDQCQDTHSSLQFDCERACGGKRIDGLIWIPDAFAIIIENKVNGASDGKNQLGSYINSIKDDKAIFPTDDGKTRLYIRIGRSENFAVHLKFNQSAANAVTIDWGDGSDPETFEELGYYINAYHWYASEGDYRVDLIAEYADDTVHNFEGIATSHFRPSEALLDEVFLTEDFFADEDLFFENLD